MPKPFIPDDAEWYLADLVIAISVEGLRSTTVNINTVLVRADSPEEAYTKALELGRTEQMAYRNIDGQQIRYRFLGLRDLIVVYDKLEHGAELLWNEHRKRTLAGAKALTRPKRALAVFRPRSARPGPNLIDADLHQDLLGQFTPAELGIRPKKRVTRGGRGKR